MEKKEEAIDIDSIQYLKITRIIMQDNFVTLYEGAKPIKHPLCLALDTPRVYFCKHTVM